MEILALADHTDDWVTRLGESREVRLTVTTHAERAVGLLLGDDPPDVTLFSEEITGRATIERLGLACLVHAARTMSVVAAEHPTDLPPYVFCGFDARRVDDVASLLAAERRRFDAALEGRCVVGGVPSQPLASHGAGAVASVAGSVGDPRSGPLAGSPSGQRWLGRRRAVRPGSIVSAQAQPPLR